MRHLWSLLAGVVVAPLTWCLVALGQSGSQEQIGDWVKTNAYDTVDLIEPAAYLVVAGILLGLIATLRVSPLGPLVGGLLLIATYVGMFIAPLDVRDAVPNDWKPFDRELLLRIPLDNGTLALIGVLLLISVFSASRWRQAPAADAAAANAAATPEAPLAGLDESPYGEASREPATTLDTLVSVGAKTSVEPTNDKVKATPASSSSSSSSSKSAKAKQNRNGKPNESPWSAPPGQSRSAEN